MSNQLQIGWAATSITPDRPTYVYGQLYYRISEYVHDPITATALAVSSDDEHAILVSADVVGIHDMICAKVRKALEGVKGLDVSRITFSATHTHNSAFGCNTKIREEITELCGGDCFPVLDYPEDFMSEAEATGFFVEKLVRLVKDAWDARKPGGISYAGDYAAIGFNRRPQFDRGKGVVESKMYGACSLDTFIRFEGTVDHGIDMLYTWDLDRNLTGVLVDVPCPSQVFELHSFISADYWGYARNAIREKLGNIFVLSVCGAAGDQNPLDLARISKYNVKKLDEWNAQAGQVFRNFDMAEECESIAQRIAEPVYRGVKTARKNIETRPVFRHTVKQIKLPIRKVTEADYQEADAAARKIAAEFSPENKMTGKDLVRLFEPMGIINRWKLQRHGDDTTIHSSIIRLGDAAFCTVPFEFFVEYGLRIRARSKARCVFTMQLTNGSPGYLPTDAALAGGSYSSKPASTLVGPRGGDTLTEVIITEINRLWDQK